MTQTSCNCMVCAKEFSSDELKSVALSEINVTSFKICQQCFDESDPVEDYKEAKDIVNTYLEFTKNKAWLKKSKKLIKLIQK